MSEKTDKLKDAVADVADMKPEDLERALLKSAFFSGMLSGFILAAIVVVVFRFV